MYSAGVFVSLIIAAFTWLCILSFLFWKSSKRFKNIFPNGGEPSEKALIERFEEILKSLENVAQKEVSLDKQVKGVRVDGLGHIQKAQLARYNPYGDTGGEQSFSLALLNGKNDGVLITSLHTRVGTRVYAKTVQNGKSEIEPSKEEKELLETIIEK